MENCTRILLTPGEPAGVGPDIAILAAQQHFSAQLIAVCDPDLLLQRAALLNVPLKIEEWSDQATQHQPGTLKIIPVSLKEPCQPGILNKTNASYVIKTLEIATDFCLKKQATALVTGPIQKSILNEAGIPFSGHTEFLAERCGHVPVIMLFVAEHMKVALVTTHIPLSNVSTAITREKLVETLHLLHAELKNKFGIRQPRILVCGLNPHAGENGHLGREELDIIIPALNELRLKMNIQGPLPADTIFTEKYINDADAILAMYHDQALPVVKYLGFGKAVNVTLGLPIIRTSVDHGTALDVAGTTKAKPDSLITAIQLAVKLA